MIRKAAPWVILILVLWWAIDHPAAAASDVKAISTAVARVFRGLSAFGTAAGK